MEDTLQNRDESLLAVELGKLLEDHRGVDVTVMDMRPLNFWTDFFVIASVTSNTHLAGLERHVNDFALEKGLEILHRSRKPEGEDEWCLLDLGAIIIHLMSSRVRDFFELERLWNAAPVIFKAHSSKSS
jgi:ribosome-associated protein